MFKKLALYLLVCAVAFAAVACNNNRAGSVPGETPPAAGAGTELSRPAENSETSELVGESGVRYNKEEFSDANVTVALSFDRVGYTTDNVIRLEVTISNNSGKTIAFPYGSGSNRVPDAISVTLGELAAMYKPAIMTMDFRVEEMAPGESITYELPYAPFIALDPSALPGAGFDQPLAFFHSDDYTPAETGEIQGTLRFSYDVLDESEEPENLENTEFSSASFFGNNPGEIIEGSFRTQII